MLLCLSPYLVQIYACLHAHLHSPFFFILPLCLNHIPVLGSCSRTISASDPVPLYFFLWKTLAFVGYDIMYYLIILPISMVILFQTYIFSFCYFYILIALYLAFLRRHMTPRLRFQERHQQINNSCLKSATSPVGMPQFAHTCLFIFLHDYDPQQLRNLLSLVCSSAVP